MDSVSAHEDSSPTVPISSLYRITTVTQVCHEFRGKFRGIPGPNVFDYMMNVLMLSVTTELGCIDLLRTLGYRAQPTIQGLNGCQHLITCVP